MVKHNSIQEDSTLISWLWWPTWAVDNFRQLHSPEHLRYLHKFGGPSSPAVSRFAVMSNCISGLVMLVREFEIAQEAQRTEEFFNWNMAVPYNVSAKNVEIWTTVKKNYKKSNYFFALKERSHKNKRKLFAVHFYFFVESVELIASPVRPTLELKRSVLLAVEEIYLTNHYLKYFLTFMYNRHYSNNKLHRNYTYFVGNLMKKCNNPM